MALTDLRQNPATAPNPAANLAPPMLLSKEDLATYYHRLGDIEAFYFYLCRVDELNNKRMEWRFLCHKFEELTEKTNQFVGHLQSINALCADQLQLDLDNALRILWLDGDSDTALHDFLSEEGREICSYNENNWHKDPHFWEDQTGLQLNDLALQIDKLHEPGVSAGHISAFEYINEQRQHVLEEWVENAAEKVGIQFAGRMRYWHRKGIESTNGLIDLLRNPPSGFHLWKRVLEFARWHNDRGEIVARVYRRVLRPRAFYDEPYPYPNRMDY